MYVCTYQYPKRIPRQQHDTLITPTPTLPPPPSAPCLCPLPLSILQKLKFDNGTATAAPLPAGSFGPYAPPMLQTYVEHGKLTRYHQKLPNLLHHRDQWGPSSDTGWQPKIQPVGRAAKRRARAKQSLGHAACPARQGAVGPGAIHLAEAAGPNTPTWCRNVRPASRHISEESCVQQLENHLKALEIIWNHLKSLRVI